MTIAYVGNRGTPTERSWNRRHDRIVSRFWHHRLTRDRYEYGYERATTPEMGPWRQQGHLRCFSRYGDDSDECAWWAIALGFIYSEASGEGFTPEAMEWNMGLVVNDGDGVAQLVWAYWYAVPPFVRRYLGTRETVAALIFDFTNWKREEGYA